MNNPELLSSIEDARFAVNQERRARDGALTARIQAGYTPPAATEQNPQPRIIDGTLTPDGAAALDELWGHYERAAIKEANRFNTRVYAKPGVDVEDLVQEGFWGLYHSALRWSPDRGYTLLTHARLMMRVYMTRYTSDCKSTVRVPSHKRDEVRRLKALNWKTYQTTQHFPGRFETARLIGGSAGAVDEIRITEAMTDEMGSLDGGYFEDSRDGPSTYGAGESRWKPIDPAATEQREVESEIMANDVVKIVNEILSNPDPYRSAHLTDREILILKWRFLSDQPKTLREVGLELGLGPERVRQIEARTLSKLRSPFVAPLLIDYARNS